MDSEDQARITMIALVMIGIVFAPAIWILTYRSAPGKDEAPEWHHAPGFEACFSDEETHDVLCVAAFGRETEWYISGGDTKFVVPSSPLFEMAKEHQAKPEEH